MAPPHSVSAAARDDGVPALVATSRRQIHELGEGRREADAGEQRERLVRWMGVVEERLSIHRIRRRVWRRRRPRSSWRSTWLPGSDSERDRELLRPGRSRSRDAPATGRTRRRVGPSRSRGRGCSMAPKAPPAVNRRIPARGRRTRRGRNPRPMRWRRSALGSWLASARQPDPGPGSPVKSGIQGRSVMPGFLPSCFRIVVAWPR